MIKHKNKNNNKNNTNIVKIVDSVITTKTGRTMVF